MKLTRRELLKAGSAAGFMAAHPLMASLAGLHSAAARAAEDADDYKALVCVFLNGGNDWANTLVPFDEASYLEYANQRPALAYSRAAVPTLGGAPIRYSDGSPMADVPPLAALEPLAGHPLKDRNDAERQFALAPPLFKLQNKFDSGRMAVLMNVGTLVEPIAHSTGYPAANVPPRLFSHNDQTAYWQSSGVEGQSTGWAGKIEDSFLHLNAEPSLSCIGVSGNALLLTGEHAVQYQVTTAGPVICEPLTTDLFGSAACSAALKQIITGGGDHMFEREHSRVTARAIDVGEVLGNALAGTESELDGFDVLKNDSANPLGRQLGMVARMIAAGRTGLNLKRQVFHVSVGGWDMHSDLTKYHPGALRSVADALEAFDTLASTRGWSDSATVFTASEFGRTLRSNGNGSDHGWGSMQFVLGGAVNGRRYYGLAPVIANEGPDDVGAGRLLPTTAVEQVAATLAIWMGITDQTELESLFGNLGNFSPYDLGFMKQPQSSTPAV